MRRNMKQWLAQLREMPEKKALPVLSFPAVQLMGISVRELISDSDRQAQGMKLVADRTDAAAAVSLMDLSVEAECLCFIAILSPIRLLFGTLWTHCYVWPERHCG